MEVVIKALLEWITASLLLVVCPAPAASHP